MDDNPTNDSTNVNDGVAPAEPQTPVEQAPSEPTTEQVDTPQEEQPTEVPTAPEVPEPGQKPEPGQPSRRETLRIQNLLNKYGTPKRDQAPSQPLDYKETLDADDDTISQLEQDRQSAAQQQYNQGLQQAVLLNWHTNLRIDAPQVESKYDVLNPNNTEKFNPAASDAVSNFYLAIAGYDKESQTVANPNITYAEFTDAIMELAGELASIKNQETVKNVTTQAANTGIRPNGSTAPVDLSKRPEEMNLDELYAAIGQKNPNKK